MMMHAVARTAGAVTLSADERLILWGMRTWIAGTHAEIPVSELLARTFATVGAELAVPTLDSVMALLHAARLQGFHHPWCRCMSDEERLLLDILALHQRGEDGAALFLTRMLLSRSAARLLGASLHALATALLVCGVRLSDGRGRTAKAATMPPAVWAPSTATLH
ncbi:MAG TPA: hypothetical protein VD978_32120 [Azospirillum sp.]|nr:hypothetical protein [Azospirillum sp.]